MDGWMDGRRNGWMGSFLTMVSCMCITLPCLDACDSDQAVRLRLLRSDQ